MFRAALFSPAHKDEGSVQIGLHYLGPGGQGQAKCFKERRVTDGGAFGRFRRLRLVAQLIGAVNQTGGETDHPKDDQNAKRYDDGFENTNAAQLCVR